MIVGSVAAIATLGPGLVVAVVIGLVVAIATMGTRLGSVPGLVASVGSYTACVALSTRYWL